jgi:outer membrane protein OmpA-like peptidoglycan-associated protein
MMRKTLFPALVVVLIAGVTLTGCATKKYVNDQIASSDEMANTKIGEVQSSVEENQKAISDLEAKDKELEAQIAKLSETAADALKRAKEAGVLAKGEFVAEVVITDNDATFAFDKYSLSDEAKAALDAFAGKLKSQNTNVYIEIQGHTDNIGSESYNLKLGYKRAEKAMQYLNMEQGVPLHRMNIISYGEYKPIADNSTREGRAQNRRVALVVLE